ncbi:MAG: ABC transporter ATP-binding protein [Anaerolineaceae bacterium]|nr:ABC transporter ATP-binding protein [Anaerolineaceae bacterium]
MIYAENLTKKFDDFVAVNSIHLDVPMGQVLVLLGPNGAGKTTTVRMLDSILVPTEGRAVVAGYDVVKDAEQVRTNVGVLTEHHGLYGRMSGDEYLEFFGELYGLSRSVYRERIDMLLKQVGMDFARHRRLGEYSKGMRQKLSLVRAMLHNPPVLLLDEPTSAMDPESARMVRDAINEMRSSDRTFLLCTHNLQEAEELADQVAIIWHGRIIASGPLQEMKTGLLGPMEYEACLANQLDGWKARLPKGVDLTARGENWLRFRIEDPDTTNPGLLRSLLDDRLDVVSFREVPHTLEEAYLKAVSQVHAENETGEPLEESAELETANV